MRPTARRQVTLCRSKSELGVQSTVSVASSVSSKRSVQACGTSASGEETLPQIGPFKSPGDIATPLEMVNHTSTCTVGDVGSPKREPEAANEADSAASQQQAENARIVQ